MSGIRHRFLIAPMCAGKSTYAAANRPLVVDVDDSRNPSDEPELKRLREAGLWPDHNSLWHSGSLLPWYRSLTVQRVILAHSMFDVLAMDPGALSEHRVAFVLPSPSVMRERRTARLLTPQELRLSQLNYTDAVADQLRYDAPVMYDFPPLPFLRFFVGPERA